MKKPRKPTAAMNAMLLRAHKGLSLCPPHWSMAEQGAATGTRRGLKQRGLLDAQNKITDAGVAHLRAELLIKDGGQ